MSSGIRHASLQKERSDQVLNCMTGQKYLKLHFSHHSSIWTDSWTPFWWNWCVSKSWKFCWFWFLPSSKHIVSCHTPTINFVQCSFAESYSKLHFSAEVLFFLENSILTCKRYKTMNGMRLQVNSVSSSMSWWSQHVPLIIWCHLTNGYISQACLL